MNRDDHSPVLKQRNARRRKFYGQAEPEAEAKPRKRRNRKPKPEAKTERDTAPAPKAPEAATAEVVDAPPDGATPA